MTVSEKIEMLETAQGLIREAANLIQEAMDNDPETMAYVVRALNGIAGGDDANPYNLNIDTLIYWAEGE